MISLEQILVLEQKVESAVAKIAQLTAENDALRSKCAELTNALSVKTEQLSAFQSDQNKIELGIIKALQQLDAIKESKTAVSENVLETTDSPIANEENPIQEEVSEQSSDEGVEESVADTNEDVVFEAEIKNEVVVAAASDEQFNQDTVEIQQNNNDLSDEDKDFIIQLLQKGKTIEEISQFLNNDIEKVRAIVEQYQENNTISSKETENSDIVQEDSNPFDIFNN